ncbi:unnamed protein product [Rangifer tarandus platyrhynchus]|uniref:Uncharacterized protein n=2 Tax=Rangifer tarandus platyrhynchus TaxID=3082113 RepID=A0ACB0EG29_RANTA|nr:unnamed protein product [Rangifer tarandus platyrhynchus]CAI9699209.1 unnamed protein product [Rangifer tarandus platyrhynchus]
MDFWTRSPPTPGFGSHFHGARRPPFRGPESPPVLRGLGSSQARFSRVASSFPKKSQFLPSAVEVPLPAS